MTAYWRPVSALYVISYIAEGVLVSMNYPKPWGWGAINLDDISEVTQFEHVTTVLRGKLGRKGFSLRLPGHIAFKAFSLLVQSSYAFFCLSHFCKKHSVRTLPSWETIMGNGNNAEYPVYILNVIVVFYYYLFSCFVTFIAKSEVYFEQLSERAY